MIALAIAALIPLLLDPPAIGPADQYKIYFGTSPGVYTNVTSFAPTNQFVITNAPVGRVYVACSAVNATGESELSSEIAVQVFVGDVQLAPSPTGPWTNYMAVTIPLELKEPARFVRVKLEIE